MNPIAVRAGVPSDDRARDTLESIGDAVITTDLAGTITYLNPTAVRLTGWTADEATGEALDIVFPLIAEGSRLRLPNPAVRCLEEGRSIDLEDGVLLLRRDGSEVPIGDSAAPLKDRDGNNVGVVLVIQNESEKRRASHRLSYEATHDPLTGLLNRREFERRLTRATTEFPAGTEHGLIVLDLDRFKTVNDAAGHEAGDELLRRLGNLLTRATRRRDSTARLGGDEFAVLLEHCPLSESERIAENIRAGIEQLGFEWAGAPYSISASIGLMLIGAETGGPAAAMRQADAASYRAKELGGSRIARR